MPATDRSAWTTLTGIDPDAPLDDLAPLAGIVGDARVVAIGESAHFVAEFNRARMRLARFLAERCGFRVFAYEFGFAAGFAVDPWVRGAGDVADLASICPSVLAWGGGELLGFLRRHNESGGRPIHFAGIDQAEAGGTLLPELRHLRDYLADVDPESAPRLAHAVELAARIAAATGPAAVPAWQELGPSEQDALTAVLSRTRLRLRALEPLLVARGGRERYDIAAQHLAVAEHTDYGLRVSEGLLFTHDCLPADTSVRDRLLADCVHWHLEHGDARIMVVAHNAHIQKTPVVLDPGDPPIASPMGHYLHRELGADYVSIALAHTARRMPEMRMDATTAVGFTIEQATLPEPEPGSLETLVPEGETGLLDLRAVHPPPEKMRLQTGYVHTDVTAAFDAALFVPTATLDPGVTL